MKRIRIGQFSRQWLATAPAGSTTITSRVSRLSNPAPAALRSQIRCQSTVLTPDQIFDEEESRESSEESASFQQANSLPKSLPSPHPDRAPRSAKLAALHARLSLSKTIPLQVLGRALVDPSADPHPQFNNANLAFVGASLLQYHTSEWIVTKYPRLPMGIVFAAMKGYAGEPALVQIAKAWGVEAAAAPGEGVDPGYLQFSRDKPTVLVHKWGYARAEVKELEKYKWRRGMSSRVVFDDPFGDVVSKEKKETKETTDEEFRQTRDPDNSEIRDAAQNAHANFVRAVVGAVYLYCGSEAAKTFIKAYVLSRTLDVSNLFSFRLPQRELTRLCDRENFDPPVARLLSETGRLSRTPVYVVGIYSGYDMLGEAAGSDLESAKIAATINALKSWYLYSPPDASLPSDTLDEGAAPWKPAYVDIGEIIS